MNGEILYENAFPNPKTHYGKSKLAAENYILSKKLPKDKKVYILRPCMIHGPGNRGNLNLLYSLVKKGIPYPLGAFQNLRSFTSVYNLSIIIFELIQKDVIAGIYNIADDDPVSTIDIVRLMADSLGKNPRILKIPVRLIKAISQIGDLLYLPFNNESLQKLTESYVVSNTKIKLALGIKRMPVDSKDGLEYTFESFKR